MIKIGDKYFNSSVMQILEELKSQLALNNIDKLRVLKLNGNNAQITCPIHKGGKESKPSAGVVLYADQGVEAGTCHCFTCGYVATLPELVSHCFGYNDNGRFGTKWLLQNFANTNIKERHSLELHSRKQQTLNTYVSETELDSYRYYHPYMYKRGLTDELINLFDVGFDKKSNCITFPVNDEFGNCVFIARRSVTSKFFNYPGDVTKPVYALDKIPKTIKTVVICESIINALTCWKYGDYAVALLGTGTSEQYEILKRTNIRKFVLAFDGDSAGDNASIRFKNALKDKAVITKLNIPRNKDVNDLSEQEYKNLIEKYF